MKFFTSMTIGALSCITMLSAQDSVYLQTQVLDSDQGRVHLELKNVSCGELQTARMLWIYGDGNFDLVQSCDQYTDHRYRTTASHDPVVFSMYNYDDGKPPLPPKKPMLEYIQGPVTGGFVPTGQPVALTGWVAPGHYGAVRTFPGTLQPQYMPLVMIALNNHQQHALSGRVYLYYKNNLTRNGETSQAVQYTRALQLFDYGGVSAIDLQYVPPKTGYTAIGAWNYSNLTQDEERHIFAAMDAHAEWDGIPDLNTAQYQTKFLIVVNGSCDAFSFENETSVDPVVESSHDPAFLETSREMLADGTEVQKLDLLFYNEGNAPVSSIRVECKLPEIWKDLPVTVLENAIGPVELKRENPESHEDP